jgi:hypothetical protein
MDIHKIAVVCAIIGAVMTPIYLTLGVVGVRMIRKMRAADRQT